MKKVVLFIMAIILLSVESNCQWYNKKYGVNDLSQLSQEQLTEASMTKKNQIYGDIALAGMGSLLAFGGISLINYVENKTAELDYNVIFWDMVMLVMGYGIFIGGSGVGITGLILIPIHLSQRSEINKILKSTKIKIGLINYPVDNVFNCSEISAVPGVSMTIYF